MPTPPNKRRRPWHPWLADIIKKTAPRGFSVTSEYELNTEPQRIDILVVRRQGKVESRGDVLDILYRYFSTHNIIEFKSPADDVEGKDIDIVLAYTHTYASIENLVTFDDVRVFILCEELKKSFMRRLQKRGVELDLIEPGIWRGTHGCLIIMIYELGVVGGHEIILGLFSRSSFSQAGRKIFTDPNRVELGAYILRRIEGRLGDPDLTPREKNIMAWNYQEYLDELIRKNVGLLSIEERLEGVPTDELLRHVPTDELLRHVPAEERLSGIPADELLRHVPADELLHNVPANERVRGLSPLERLQGLEPAELEELQRHLVATLKEGH